MYEARFLGGATLRLDDAPVAGPASQRHPLALLALLAAHPVGEVSRDQLVAYLWPDRETGPGRHLLSEALYVLRSTVGRDAIRSVGAGLVIDPGLLWTDVQAFVGASDSGNHRGAVEVYRGPFLDGFHLHDDGELQHWADGRRAHLAASHARSLDALAEEAASADDQLEAAHWLRLRLALDPCSGSSTRRLMTALARAGDRAEAIRVGRAYETRLRDELGLPPAEDVIRLRARLESPHWITPRRAPKRWIPGLGEDRRASARRPPDAFADAPPTSAGASADPVAERTAPRLRGSLGLVVRALPAAAAVAVLLTLGIRFAVHGASATSRSGAVAPRTAVVPFAWCCDEGLDLVSHRFAAVVSDTVAAAPHATLVDPATVPDAWWAEGPPGSVTDEELEAFAVRLQVARYVTGAVLEAGPSRVYVALSLREVGGSAPIYTRYASGPSTEAEAMFDALAGGLAERLRREPERRGVLGMLDGLSPAPR